MKILYDYQALIMQKFGGISRYFYDLLKVMNEDKLAEGEIHCKFNANFYFKDQFGGKMYKTSGKRFKVYDKVNKIYMKKVLKKADYDIVHPTYYDPYIIDNHKGKMVITVYDMIHEIMPEYFSPDEPIPANKKKMLYAADHIIAISESTKRDILKLYPAIPEDKISVIYIGSSFEYIDDPSLASKFPEKYVLFVGTRSLYKNYKNFAEAMLPLLKADKSLSMVLAGGGSLTDEEEAFLSEVREQVVQMDINDRILSYAYSHAECFVFPSMYEGFGIPTLEAFACNCPVVLSTSSSMPEVGGDAVKYIDPYNVEDIREKIVKVINDENLRKEMTEKGQVQLKKFDWKEIAGQTVSCYERVVSE